MRTNGDSTNEALQLTRTQRAVLERIVSELSDDPETQRNVVDMLAQVSGIETVLANGGGSNLTLAGLMRFLRSETETALGSAAASRSAQGQRAQAQVTQLAAIGTASRTQVQSLLRDMHRFDPYLSFASPEDGEAYRRREAERRAYIEQQHARGTPEGDLNASGAAIGQMVDAQAHGGADSPEFRQRWNELAGTTARLREQVARAGGSTAEFDNRVRDELRATLRGRGVSDTEIDARLAAHPGDPLAAVRNYMRSEDDLRAIDRSISQIGRRESTAPAPPPVVVAVAEQPAGSVSMADVMAEFRACGITPADHQPGEAFSHGVAACERPAQSPVRH